jgi:hypothetical protein
MAKRLAAAAAVILTVAVIFSTRSFNLSTSVAAQAPSTHSAQPPQQAPSNMQDMTKMHEQMMAEMKAADSRLDALVKDMNGATGDAKVTAMAAVVTELVRQQKSMHDHMGQMHQMMMGGRGMMMKK